MADIPDHVQEALQRAFLTHAEELAALQKTADANAASFKAKKEWETARYAAEIARETLVQILGAALALPAGKWSET